jgi:flagellin-like protein
VKGASELLTLIILFAIVVTAIVIVIVTSQPTVETALSSTDIKNAENILKTIDDNIREVAREGPNSTRVVAFTAPKRFETIPEEDAVQFSTTSGIFEYLTRVFSNNFVYIAGSDVRCAQEDGDNDGDNDLVLENQRIKGVFLSVAKSTPYASYDTASTLLRVVEKTGNNTIIFTNTSVVIDDNLLTTSGNGYSEISSSGQALPSCQVHFFMNSTVDYDIYYKLYAGADFFVVEVRNIR